MQSELFENTPNLDVIEGSVEDILLNSDNQCSKVLLGGYYTSKISIVIIIFV